MPKTNRYEDLDTQSFLKDLAFDLSTEFATADTLKSITEFVETEIDQEAWGVKLSLKQWALLKSFYGEDLTDEEISVLESWRAQDRCTWEPNRHYQSLIVECGRRGGKCRSLNSTHLSSNLGLVYGYELLQEIMPNVNTAIHAEKGLTYLPDLPEGTSLNYRETVAQEGYQKKAETDGVYYKGISATKKIKTSCGYQLEATPEHRIKVIAEDGTIQWRYFADLKPGDYTCIHRNTFLFPQTKVDATRAVPPEPQDSRVICELLPNQVDENLGRLIGLLVADGAWSRPKDVVLTCHIEDLEHYLNAVHAVFPETEYRIYPRTNSKGVDIKIHRVYVRQYFHNLGWTTDSTPTTKATPWSIRRSPKEVVAAYLSGLFDGDGTVEKGGRCISISSASHKLLHETQLLLLNFGIVSRLKTKLIKGKPYYILTLRGKRSVVRFVEQIGFGLERKRLQVQAYLDSKEGSKDGGDTERIPYQTKWLRQLIESTPSLQGKQPGSHHGVGIQQRNLRKELKALIGNAGKEGSTELLSSYRLQAIIDFATEHKLDKAATNHLRHLLELDYFYDPIKTVEDSEAACMDLSVPEGHQYVANGFTNHNSQIAAVIVAYEFYKLCHIPNPQLHYGISSSTPISILVLATTAEQAKRTIFKHIVGMFRVVKFFRRLSDKGLLFIGQQEIKYEEKLLYIYSGNSQSSGQVGQSAIMLVMDEVARFDDEAKSEDDSNALELWSNLGISGVTFGRDARRIAISSAWCINDAIEQLYKNSIHEDSWLGFRLRTWDLNPTATRDNPLVASEYSLNPNKAALEFEGVRRASENAFFDLTEIKNCFRGDYVLSLERVGDRKNKLHLTNCKPFRGPNYMYLDPSIIHDSYAVAFGHKELDDMRRVIAVVDGIVVWQPEPDHPVSILNVQEVILGIHQRRPLFKVGADHHNSAETIERLRRLGIPSQANYASNRLQLSQYETARELMHEGRLVFPRYFTWKNLLLDEATRVTLKKGIKIDHPADGSKDVIDAVCGLVWLMCGTKDSGSAPVIGRGKITNGSAFTSTNPDYSDNTFTPLESSFGGGFRRSGGFGSFDI